MDFLNNALEIQKEYKLLLEHNEGLFFETFYSVLIEYGIEKLQNNLRNMNEIFSEKIYMDFGIYLAEQLQAICMRTLIAEMHIYKSNGKLQGDNKREEYKFFCTSIISKIENIKQLMERYPVLCRCVEERIAYSVNFYKEIIDNFKKDKITIAEKIIKTEKDIYITAIKSKYSDVHKCGRQVVKIQINDKDEILYKPHAMENEKKFGELLEWLSNGLEMEQLKYSFLSYKDHSWCSIVKYKDCQSKKEMSRYYQRLGMQLFLAYFLGTHDLHCENIIASGEYPVLIDLETLINISYIENRETVEAEMSYRLAHSVLCTGLLPVYTWNKGGKGIDTSGMSGGAGERYPFKIPFIVESETSEMHIVYDYPKAKSNQNLARLRGRLCNPIEYEEELIEGFVEAYRYVLTNLKEFREKIESLECLKSRFLAMHTQRYSMALSSSYHPSLLQDGAERELFLMSMWKGREECERELVENEILSLLQGDIPYYEYYLNSKNLYSGMGADMGERLAKKPITTLLEKIDDLSETDMNIQQNFIRIALELMPENRKKCENKAYYVKDNICTTVSENYKNIVDTSVMQLVKRIFNEAIWNRDRNEVNWYQIKLSSEKNMTWDLGTMDMYLYSGLAGMLLLFYDMKFRIEKQKSEEIYGVLRKMLFLYTDQCVQSVDNVQSKKTGAYEGESSIIFAYLILYEKSQDLEYLEYAKKHAKVVGQLLDKDERYDMLSGNAGAAYVFLKLYDCTENKYYLEQAEHAIGILLQHAERQERGIGWRITRELPPMSGMAHGNAGILMPVIRLWKETGKKEYEELAEEIWEYENSLYDQRIENWHDVRSEDIKKEECGAVAWCHGAGGVLISRLYCNELVNDEKWKKRLENDIHRAYKKLKHYWKRDSWSLCHGICGNLWILEKCERNCSSKWKEYMADFKMLPQELVNPGLMNGYGGCIFYLITRL